MGDIIGHQQPEDEGPIELEGVPEEEGVSEADAVDRIDQDPAEQPNRPEQADFDPEERRQYDDPPVEKAGPDTGGTPISQHDHPEDR